MRFSLLIVALAVTLGGCAAADPIATDPPVVEPSETPTPAPTETGPIADDPAEYPAPGQDGLVGVQFTLADGQLMCSIFDPAGSNEFQAAPFFGCVVNAPGFPYPPITGGPMDSANAFLSAGHGAGHETTVTDATFSGNGVAPALPAGHSLTWSTVTCEALAADEVNCIDADSGHGMRVSASDYEVF